MIPNMYARMANPPALLATYQDGYARCRAESGFNSAEQEVAFLAISREHECAYCLAAHSFVADVLSRVPRAVTDAIRDDAPIHDGKLAALAGFVRHLVATRGARATTVEVTSSSGPPDAFGGLLVSLIALAWVVEARDPYTGGHLWRVSRGFRWAGCCTTSARSASRMRSFAKPIGSPPINSRSFGRIPAWARACWQAIRSATSSETWSYCTMSARTDGDIRLNTRG